MEQNFDLSAFIEKARYKNTMFDIMEFVPPSVLKELTPKAKERLKREVGGIIPPDKMSSSYKEAWEAINS